MNKKDLVYFLPVIFTFLFTLTLSLPAPLIGTDILFQLDMARLYAVGNFSGAQSVALSINSIPYPPLFQFILVPSIWLGIEYQFIAFLQVFFLPLAILSLELLFYLRGMKFEAVFAGTLVLTSFAYVDRSLQPIPIALDMILLPLTIHFALVKNDKWFILLSSIILYNHGIMGVSVLGGLFLYKLFKKEYKSIILIVLISLPVILIAFPYVPQALKNFTGKINTDQQRAFLNNPVLFTYEYMGQSLIIGFPIILLGYWAISSRIVKKKLDDLDKISILTLGSMLLTTIFQQDRFLQYSTIPLAILFTNYVGQSKYKSFWMLLTVGLATLFYLLLWFWLFIGMFDIQLGYKI